MSEAIARQALKHWDLGGSLISLVAQRENKVYSVVDRSTGQTRALRLHRPGLRNETQLVSELQWMKALSASGLAVPTPIATTSGAWCVEAGGHWIDLQTWLPGDSIDHHAEPRHYYALGQAMAKLHTVSDDWVSPSGFHRHAWDRHGLVGDDPVWGRFWDSPALDKPQATLLRHFRSAALKELTKNEHTFDYGLIHADLVSENVLVHEDRLHLIDFDDSGYGFRLFEVATTILRLQRIPGQENLIDALIQGYTANRLLDLNMLNLFMALRACTYIGWIISRLDEPEGYARCARFIRTGCLRVERWLG